MRTNAGIFFCFVLIGASFFSSCAYADVALKIVAANPSQTETKKAKIKSYLPEEVTAGDVISNGGLQVGYDDGKKRYYVSGEAELAPGQSVEREVIIRDIWKIDAKQLDAKRVDAEKIAKALSLSEFSDKSAALRDAVAERLDRIAKSQSVAAISPAEHIARYRSNTALVAEVDADLAVARTLMLSSKRLPASNVWFLLLSVCGFFAVIAGSLFYFWQSQVKPDGMASDGTGRSFHDLSDGGARKKV